MRRTGGGGAKPGWMYVRSGAAGRPPRTPPVPRDTGGGDGFLGSVGHLFAQGGADLEGTAAQLVGEHGHDRVGRGVVGEDDAVHAAVGDGQVPRIDAGAVKCSIFSASGTSVNSFTASTGATSDQRADQSRRPTSRRTWRWCSSLKPKSAATSASRCWAVRDGCDRQGSGRTA